MSDAEEHSVIKQLGKVLALIPESKKRNAENSTLLEEFSSALHFAFRPPSRVSSVGEKLTRHAEKRRAAEQFLLRYEDGSEDNIVGWADVCERTGMREQYLRIKLSDNRNAFQRVLNDGRLAIVVRIKGIDMSTIPSKASTAYPYLGNQNAAIRRPQGFRAYA